MIVESHTPKRLRAEPMHNGHDAIKQRPSRIVVLPRTTWCDRCRIKPVLRVRLAFVLPPCSFFIGQLSSG